MLSGGGGGQVRDWPTGRQDTAGATISAQLRDELVADALLVGLPGMTRPAQVWVSTATGTRTIAYVDSLPVLEHLPENARRAVETSNALILDGRDYPAALAAAQLMRRRGLVSLDLGGSVKAGIEVLTRLAGVHIQPAFWLPVVDSNGAGDSFHGGLLAGLLGGESHQEAMRWAAAVAALKVSAPGDVGLPTRAALSRSLLEHPASTA